MFKIAYCAGHDLVTQGKRIPASLDKTQTREWVLNNRVANHFAVAALEYKDVEILRTDDPTGEFFIDIPDRTHKANIWGADIYIDMHHNAAGKVFSGGGVEAFCFPNSEKGKEYRDAIYEAVVATGGLKGNRANPLQEKAFDSLRFAYAPAVLVEYGFMNSMIDAPIILTDNYSKKVAYATMEGIAKVAGLKKREVKEHKTVEYGLTLQQLRMGDTGEDVRSLQILLMGKKYSCGESGADGIFGYATEKAVIAYQKNHNLYADGIAGEKTMKSLLGV